MTSASKALKKFITENFDIKMKLPVIKEIRDGKTFLKIENPEMTFDIIG